MYLHIRFYVHNMYIPHYQLIKPKALTEGYFDMNHPMQKCSLMTQLRLNKFSIKIVQFYIRTDLQCLLCNDTCSVEHIMFSCISLKSQRHALIYPLIPNCNPINFSSMQLYVALFSATCNDKLLNNIFLSWHKVAKYFDLCSDL